MSEFKGTLLIGGKVKKKMIGVNLDRACAAARGVVLPDTSKKAPSMLASNKLDISNVHTERKIAE